MRSRNCPWQQCKKLVQFVSRDLKIINCEQSQTKIDFSISTSHQILWIIDDLNYTIHIHLSMHLHHIQKPLMSTFKAFASFRQAKIQSLFRWTLLFYLLHQCSWSMNVLKNTSDQSKYAATLTEIMAVCMWFCFQRMRDQRTSCCWPETGAQFHAFSCFETCQNAIYNLMQVCFACSVLPQGVLW